LIGYIKNKLKEFYETTDVLFLLFLLLVTNVSLGVKLVAVILIYVLRPNFKFDLKNARIPVFYPAIIVLSVIQYFINYGRGTNYAILAMLVIAFWTMAFLITNQLKTAIERQGTFKIGNALKWYFILNAVVSAVNYLKIVLETGAINPYTFDGFNYKYSASTGDYIHGITYDISTVNMVMNSLGLFYFLYQKQYRLSLMCFIVATFTTSNLGNFILIFFFTLVIIIDRSRLHKSIVLCYMAFLCVFIIKISPSNLNYLNYKLSSLLKRDKRLITVTFEDRSEKDKLISGYVNKTGRGAVVKPKKQDELEKIIAQREKAQTESPQQNDSVFVVELLSTHQRYLDFYTKYYGDTNAIKKDYYNKYPGKLLSMIETVKFLKTSPKTLIVGAGGGNFSSKLAFKASNLGVMGRYVDRYAYVSDEFKNYHLKLTLSYYLQSSTEHSIINFPNSVFNQILGEYGLIGFILFLVFYVWFFLRHYSKLSFGKVLLPFFLCFLFTDYWFEAFNIFIIFELMMFIDLAKIKQENANS
jgi:hypothetical protein